MKALRRLRCRIFGHRWVMRGTMRWWKCTRCTEMTFARVPR